MSSAHLLKLAIPLVATHGFTREALARSVLALSPTPHRQPLSDTSVSSLFGQGDDARRVLINAWMDDAVQTMKTGSSPSIKSVLRTRLERNESVLEYLPEAYAILMSPSGPSPIDPVPVMKHAAKIADEACYITGDTSNDLSWYTRRASLAAVYTAAELHQLASPQTAYDFLDSLLDNYTLLKSSVDEVGLFSSYVGRSWAGIIKSSGIF